MNTDWFQTWDRPEYLEWATEIPEGYLLHIVRKEKQSYLVVQAKLIMGEQGVPGFETIQQTRASDEKSALQTIESWKQHAALSLT